MLKKVIGQAIMGKDRKRLSGGPQALKPLRPTKGSGIKNGTGQAQARGRQFVTPRQNPALTPGSGQGGLALRGMQMKRGRSAPDQGRIGLGRKKVNR